MTRAVGSVTSSETSTFFMDLKAQLPPVDSQQLPRLVGYLEYGQALAMLTPLMNQVTPEELRVIDEFVKSRDEYMIYSNLHQRYLPRPAAAKPTATASTATASAERRGLAWVMALARVELGAMLAGFTTADEPFAIVAPGPYEQAAFQEILLDAALTHYVAFKNDPVAHRFASFRNAPLTAYDRARGRRGVDEQQAVAYARRVWLARKLIQSAHEAGFYGLAPAEQLALRNYSQELYDLQDIILTKVLGLGSTQVYLSHTSIGPTREINEQRFRGCPPLMAAARSALRSGSTVTARQVGQ